ncbi:MAG TPA: nuclear transport factor 2 family protein [Reyranella sp.]|jgi:uncharacterized protein (TIGR02246 family)|nr:nuclear transport factor 2 family protein [Reyranella sp.]
MTVLHRRLLLAAPAVAALAGRTSAAGEGPVEIMQKYAVALQANDVEALVSLYTDNGVYVRPDFPAAVGHAALRTAYKEVFATLRVSLRFDIKEAEIHGDMAWVRSESTSKIKVLKSGAETSESYHQLVVFRREAGVWKIRSYLYSPAKA